MDRFVSVPVNRRAIAVRVAVFVAIVVLVAIIVVLRNNNPGSSSPPGTPGTTAVSRTDQPVVHHPQFQNCAEAHAAGRTNIPRGDLDYLAPLDRDGDGIACEAGTG
jgi:Excalibur calcium-binding domain